MSIELVGDYLRHRRRSRWYLRGLVSLAMLAVVGGCGDGDDNPIGQVVEPPPDTEDAPALAVERVYPSLTFVHPVAMRARRR